MSGDDSLTYHIMALGGKGVVSVASNIIPDTMVEFAKAMSDRVWNFARDMLLDLYPLFKVLFCEITPGPVKYAPDTMGIMDMRMRLPLTPPLEENQIKIDKVLADLEIFPRKQEGYIETFTKY